MLVSQEVGKKTSLQGKKMTPEINYRGFDRYFQLKLLTPEEVHEKRRKRKKAGAEDYDLLCVLCLLSLGANEIFQI